jgi:phenylacetic acid degradation protein
MGSIVGDGVKINSHCIIGAGSFIDFGTEIPPGSVVVGSPGRVIKAAGPEHLKKIAEGLAIYQELTRRTSNHSSRSLSRRSGDRAGCKTYEHREE